MTYAGMVVLGMVLLYGVEGRVKVGNFLCVKEKGEGVSEGYGRGVMAASG